MELNKTQLERQKKRRRILLILGVVAAVLVGAALAVRSWIRMPELPQEPAEPELPGVEEPGSTVTGNRKQGVYTFLLAGRDEASGSTDTMLLLSYDTNPKTIYGLNLPRDTMMNVTTSSKRLNAIYSYNKGTDKSTQVEKGMAALKQAVADLTGITPDFYVLVEWEAIGELVDAVGGVEFEVPFDMKYDDPYQDPPLHIDQKAGLRTLTGEDAMEVIRWRKNNDGGGGGGDIARLSIQQDFLKAVVKKCLQPTIILKLNSLVNIFKENVETDLTVGNILAFAEQAVGMDPATGVEFATAPLADSFKYNKAALGTLDGDGLLEIVNTKLSPYHREITLDDVEIVVRDGNGKFSVTSGELAEDIRNYTAPVAKPEPKPEPEPEQPVEPVEPMDPEQLPEPEQQEPGVEGEVPPAEGETSEPTEPGNGETVVEPDAPAPEPELPGQPEPILPEPGQEGECAVEPAPPEPQLPDPCPEETEGPGTIESEPIPEPGTEPPAV